MDDWVRSIHEETQDALAQRVIVALSTRPECQHSDKLTLVVRAWWSFAEELALTWTGRNPGTRDELVELLVETLHRMIDAAGGQRSEDLRAAREP